MDTVSLITIALLLGAVFALLAWVIKRHFIDRKWLSDGSRFIGRNVYEQWQNSDEQNRIEYVMFVEQEERVEAPTGDVPARKPEDKSP
jgi:hypothetical protein